MGTIRIWKPFIFTWATLFVGGGQAPAAEVIKGSSSWVITLDHDEVTKIVEGGAAAAVFIPAPARTIVAASSAVLRLISLAGGDKGVRILCKFDPPTLIPLPNRLASAEKLLEWGDLIGSPTTELYKLLGVPERFRPRLLPPSTEKLLEELLTETKPIGRLEANRGKRDRWERFALVAHNDGTISLRGHTGFLCAEKGGGDSVACNRKEANR